MQIKDLIVVESKNENKGTPPPPGKLGPYITTAQAAVILGVTASRVRQFIMEKRLKTYAPEKGRRDNMLKTDEVRAFKNKSREITGRPEGS